jgi:hypothetical protein
MKNTLAISSQASSTEDEPTQNNEQLAIQVGSVVTIKANRIIGHCSYPYECEIMGNIV